MNNGDLDIKINRDNIEYFDLKNQLYKVKFTNKGDVVIKFKLTDKEKQEIKKIYYENGLSKFKEKTEIKNFCNFPISITTITIIENNKTKEIKLFNSCSKYGIFNIKGRKTDNFLESIYKILYSKPEIKNAPKSNMMLI